MTKKSLNKLLSVILTLAICFTTVFGCLMTVNAAGVCCYSWSEGTVDPETMKTATINLTFTAPAAVTGGFSAITFKVASDEWDLSNAEVLSGACSSGTFDDANCSVVCVEDEDGNKTGAIEFYSSFVGADDAEIGCKNVTLELTFTFADGEAKQGMTYDVTVTNIQLGNSYEQHTHTAAAVAGVISAKCDHHFSVVGCELIETNTVDGYYVYKDVPCVNGCGLVTAYQVVPATQLKNVLYWDGTTTTIPTKTDAAGNTLITSAAELAYITNNTVTGNYKVADGIDAIVLQPETYAESIMALADYAQTKAYFESGTFKAWKNNGTFQGTFDGNGVEIYGIYAKDVYRAGLFGQVYQTTTISNVAVKNSYFDATTYASAMVGYLAATTAYNSAITALSTWAEKDKASTEYLTFEKCVVSNCYISSDSTSKTGVMVGTGASFINVAIRNCLVYNNFAIGNATAANADDIIEEGLCGNLSTSHNASNASLKNTDIANSIILDCVPFSSIEKHGQAFKPAEYTNVYTNRISDYLPCGPNGKGDSIDDWYTDGRIILIDKNAAKGPGAEDKLDLEWDSVWFADPNGGYPTFGGEIEAPAINIVYRDSNEADGTFMTADDAPKGTVDDPYIISTYGHLRYLAQNATYSNSHDKYFEFDDTIDIFVLQTETYMNNNGGLDAFLKLDAEGVKDFFVKNTSNRTQLQGNASDTDGFAGTLNGNGVHIVGGYGTSGLINEVTTGATAKNMTVSHCYFSSGWFNGNLFGRAVAGNTSATNVGTVSFENIDIHNNYQTTSANGWNQTGVLLGCASGYIRVEYNNLMVYDNIAIGQVSSTNATYKNCALIGGLPTYSGENDCTPATTNASYNNAIILGCTPYPIGSTTGVETAHNQGTKPDYWTNVYTDTLTSCTPCTNGTNCSQWSAYDITAISPSDVEGTAAFATLKEVFDFNTVWSYDGNGGYPTPNAATIPATSQFNLNLLAANIDYNTNGTFNFNFYYEDKENFFGKAPVLYVGRADGDGFTKLSGTKINTQNSQTKDLFADAGIDISNNTSTYYKYTITNLSAREINDTLLPTVVATNGASTVYGKTEPIAVADYASAILDGTVTATDADKQVVAALVNYGTLSANALAITTPNVTVATDTVYWDGATNAETFATLADADDGSGDGKSWETAIIINNAEELYYLARKSTAAETKGLYFKVADNIKNFVLQYSSVVDADKLMAMTDAAEVKAYLSSLSNCRKWTSSGSFDGNFDGNGATVYGIRSDSDSGLFGIIDGGTPDLNEYYTVNNKDYYSDYVGITIKNINVRNSWLSSGWRMGGIIAGTHGADSGADVAGTINLNSCSVANCYFDNDGYRSQNQNAGSKGLLVGSPSVDQLLMSNCLTYGNKVSITITPNNSTYTDESTWTHADRLSIVGSYADMARPDSNHNIDYKKRRRNILTNSIILGGLPHSGVMNSENNSVPACLEYVYTDQADAVFTNYTDTDLKLISATDAIGTLAKTACPNLDWINGWIVNNNDYATPAQRGAKFAAGKTIYLNGAATAPSSTADGTAENPIIISTAEELAWLVAQSATTTLKKHYKIADGIDNIVLQPESIVDISTLMSLSTPEEVKTYITGLDSNKVVNWSKINGNGVFNGSFNGNGATIYGLYADQIAAGNQNAALFSFVDGGGTDGSNIAGKTYVIDNEGNTISNINVKNSYYLSNNRIGGITACAYGGGAGYVYGKITYEACSIVNCYMETQNSSGPNATQSSGVIVGNSGGDLIAINNCLVYGNYARNTALNLDIPLLGVGPNSRTATSNSGSGDDEFIYNTVANTISIGVTPYNTYSASSRMSINACYSNVYTDAAVSSVKLYNDYNKYAASTVWITHNFTNLKQIDLSKFKGVGAKDAVDALNDAIGNEVFYVGNQYNYPALKPATTDLPFAYQGAYEAVTFTTYNNYGTSTDALGLYTTSLSLKNNPYMSLTFSFGNDGTTNYKANRQNITITLTKTSGGKFTKSDGTQVTSITLPKLPAYTEGIYISDVNGWTNKNGAGRFHLYKLDDIAVYDLCEPITVTIKYGDKTVTNTISLEGFGLELEKAYKMAPCDYYATRVEAVKALIYYTESLKTCYGK